MLPKKLVLNTFSDFRPISLYNFINKIFPRIINDRIKKLLPWIISEEQAGFINRSIAENILVVQEIMSKINKRHKPPNIVLKLDMIKDMIG